jgi:hypothetical protein
MEKVNGNKKRGHDDIASQDDVYALPLWTVMSFNPNNITLNKQSSTEIYVPPNLRFCELFLLALSLPCSIFPVKFCKTLLEILVPFPEFHSLTSSFPRMLLSAISTKDPIMKHPLRNVKAATLQRSLPRQETSNALVRERLPCRILGPFIQKVTGAYSADTGSVRASARELKPSRARLRP